MVIVINVGSFTAAGYQIRAFDIKAINILLPLRKNVTVISNLKSFIEKSQTPYYIRNPTNSQKNDQSI